MAALHPGLRRFLAKFACEIVPAGLASVVGAALVAQQWFGPTPTAQMAATADRVSVQSERIAQLIRDEHDLMVEFLKLEKEREAARQPLTIKEVRAIAESERAAQQAAAARRAAEAPKPVPRAKPAEQVPAVAIQSAPEYVPAPPPLRQDVADATAEPRRERGTLDAIVETTGEWADKAIEVSRVREAAAAVREIPSWIISIPGRVMGPSASAEQPTRFAAN